MQPTPISKAVCEVAHNFQRTKRHVLLVRFFCLIKYFFIMEKNPTIAVLTELHSKITLELLAEKKAIEPCAIKLLTLSKIVESLNFILTYVASATSNKN